MSLLFDENLSVRLVTRLHDLFPGASHVQLVGLERAADIAVWRYAAEHGLAVVSKDNDFHALSSTLGTPPKVVFVALGNCSTAEIEQAIRASEGELRAFLASDDSLLTLS